MQTLRPTTSYTLFKKIVLIIRNFDRLFKKGNDFFLHYEKTIKTYTQERFEREIETLRNTLGDHMILLNGGAIFCYIKDFGLDNNRLPSDIDIAIDIPLDDAQRLLDDNHISSHKDTEPIKLWGFVYSAPCLVARIGESSILILSKSIIKDNYGREFRIDFGNNFHTIKSKKYGIRVAGLEYLDLVKDFQSRPCPKSDISDRDIITEIVNQNPELFDLIRYFKMRFACVVNNKNKFMIIE